MKIKSYEEPEKMESTPDQPHIFSRSVCQVEPLLILDELINILLVIKRFNHVFS